MIYLKTYVNIKLLLFESIRRHPNYWNDIDKIIMSRAQDDMHIQRNILLLVINHLIILKETH